MLPKIIQFVDLFKFVSVAQRLTVKPSIEPANNPKACAVKHKAMLINITNSIRSSSRGCPVK